MDTDEKGWLVVGLGNPGPNYAQHRHNVGHMVIDLFADRLRERFRTNQRARADVAEARVGGVPGTTRAVLAKPRTYMNTSGGSVVNLLAFYRIASERLVVIHDELDLPFGAVRLKFGGGDNGHNGLKSIRRSLDTGEYPRVRVGVGRPAERQPAADYVLSPFSATERKELALVVERMADALECLLTEGLEKAQNQYHG